MAINPQQEMSEEDLLKGGRVQKNRPVDPHKNLNIPIHMFGQTENMTKSGFQGGTPMVSRPGKQTIAEYLCFSNGVKQKEYQAIDPMDFTNRPIDEIKERLKLELNILDENSSRANAILKEIDEIDGNKPLGGVSSASGSKPESRNMGTR